MSQGGSGLLKNYKDYKSSSTATPRDSNPHPLTIDFTPFETVHQWKRMLECDEFVGAR